jgi:hypothetical protein
MTCGRRYIHVQSSRVYGIREPVFIEELLELNRPTRVPGEKNQALSFQDRKERTARTSK